MGETGISRFPGNLDPRAQEFRPTPTPTPPPPPQVTTFFRQPQVYYPYAGLPLPPYASNDVQVLPFGDGSCGGVGFSLYHAYVSAGAAPLPTPPSAGPTRTLLLSSVAGDASETVVRRDLEVFGEVRGVQMERVMEGIVTVHFYDLRHAEMAFNEIRDQHMQQQQQQQQQSYKINNNNNSAAFCDNEVMMISSYSPVLRPARGLVAGRPVLSQFIVPSCNAVPDGNNQGTIVVFNLDSGVSSATLKEIFQAFGPVKELRETPLKKHQRFIEFYDVRDAAKALKEMNGQEIYGKPIVIEFSRPGGHSRKFFNANNTISCTSNINSTYQIRNSDYPQLPPPFSSSFSTRPPSYRPRFISQQPHHLRKKSPHSNSFKGNPNTVINSNYHSSSIEASVASLSLSGTRAAADSIEDVNNPRRNHKKGQSHHHHSMVSTTKHPQVKNRSSSRPWKGRQVKKLDSRFLISEEALVESNFKDPRTTVMIKNIPNKYSQKLLLNMLDNHCIHCNEQISEGDDQPLSSYDFVYLPIDFNNKCNVGYGFVNMTSPEATWRLYKAFHLQNWEVFNSRKICEVTYARVQGLEALKEHFKNSKFPSEMDHYLPVVFSPPRDGTQLTEPLSIVGLGTARNQQQSAIDHDNLDGPDTLLDDANNFETDYADETHFLIGGGDGVDDDRDSSSSGSAILVALSQGGGSDLMING